MDGTPSASPVRSPLPTPGPGDQCPGQGAVCSAGPSSLGAILPGHPQERGGREGTQGRGAQAWEPRSHGPAPPQPHSLMGKRREFRSPRSPSKCRPCRTTLGHRESVKSSCSGASLDTVPENWTQHTAAGPWGTVSRLRSVVGTDFSKGYSSLEGRWVRTQTKRGSKVRWEMKINPVGFPRFCV